MLAKTLPIISLSVALFAAAANADPVVYVISAGVTGNGQFGEVDLTTGACISSSDRNRKSIYFGLHIS